MDDHLARLCFDGGASTGHYTPQSFILRLRGVELPTDHIVYLHEVHHGALNDMTAWGTALHVYARLPGINREQFLGLLDACRVTHESLATYASVQIASARHGVVDHALNAYPRYIPLYQATARLTAQVEGPNRRQLMVTALARLCMQTPVLQIICDGGLDSFRLAAIREIDRPDGRWSWMVRQGANLLGDAARLADSTVIRRFDEAVLLSDGPAGDLYSSTDRSHDEVWNAWEAAAYERLKEALAAAGAVVMGFNDHQEGTRNLLTLIESAYGDIGLRAAMTEEQAGDDAAVASSVFQQVRHDLRDDGDRYRATLIPSPGVEPIDLMAQRPVILGRPALIIDARPPGRLAAIYDWPSKMLDSFVSPVVAVRSVADDGGEDSVIGHTVITEPEQLTILSRSWAGSGHLVSCVSASCLADSAWAQRWVSPMRSIGPLFVLVDVEPDRFVPAWVRDEREVTVIGVEVNDTSSQYAALLFTADDGAIWWIVVANDVTVRLTGEYLRARLGPRLRSNLEPYQPIRDAATVVITHLLGTESYVSFDAMESARGR